MAGSIAGFAGGMGATLLQTDAAVLQTVRGAAPLARLLVADVGCDTAAGCGDTTARPDLPRAAPCTFNGAPCLPVPARLTDLFANARMQGARISANSWGSTLPAGNLATSYTAASAALDNYVVANPDHLLIFAAGDGVGFNRITAEGMAKNVLTVGGINDGTIAHQAKTQGFTPAGNPAGAMPPLYQALDGRACGGIIASAGIAQVPGMTTGASRQGQCPANPTPTQCYSLAVAGQTTPTFQNNPMGGFPVLDPLSPGPVNPRLVQVPYALGQGAQVELALCCGCTMQLIIQGCNAAGQPCAGSPASQALLLQGLQTTYNARWPSIVGSQGPAADGAGGAANFRIKVCARAEWSGRRSRNAAAPYHIFLPFSPPTHFAA